MSPSHFCILYTKNRDKFCAAASKSEQKAALKLKKYNHSLIKYIAKERVKI